MDNNNLFYGVDSRSYRIYKIIVSIIYIYNIIVYKINYFSYFSVEHGPFSFEIVKNMSNQLGFLGSIHSDSLLYFIFLSLCIIAIFFIFNVYSIITCFILLFGYILVTNRFFPYYDGPDTLLIVILFNILLVEINIKISKQVNQDSANEFELNYNFIYVLLFQITLVYFFNGVNKTDISWYNGTAINSMLSNILINKPTAYWLLKQPFLLKFLNYFTLLFEFTCPFLIFVKHKRVYFRLILVLFILLFHWGIFIFADVGMYVFLGTANAILLLPDLFWKKINFIKLNISFRTPSLNSPLKLDGQIFKVSAYVFAILFLSFTLLSSANKQYKYNTYLKNENIDEFFRKFLPNPTSPFAQNWSMFAPKPTTNNGFIVFDTSLSVKDSTSQETLIVVNSDYKPYPPHHPLKIMLEFTVAKLGTSQFSDIQEWQLLQVCNYLNKVNSFNSINVYYDEFKQIKDNNHIILKQKILAVCN